MGTKNSRSPLASRLVINILLLLAVSALLASDDPLIILDLDVVIDDIDQDNYDRADSLHILSLNMNQFFDDVDDGNNEKVWPSRRFNTRVKSVAKELGSVYGLPQVIALQEIENLNVLHHLASEIWDHYRVKYRLIMLEGQDVSRINLAYMVRQDLLVKEIEQLFDDKLLAYDGSPLFTRPPLYLEVCHQQKCLSLVNLHLRSMRGIRTNKHGERVASKRLQQAETIAAWCNEIQRDLPQISLMLLGDLNALTPSDEYVDVAGAIRGDPDNSRTRFPARDLLEPDLIDLTLRIPKSKRYSFIYRQKKQQLDYMLVNQAVAAELGSIEFGRIDYRISDHAGLIARINW